MKEKRTLTISLSGGAASGKSITADLLHKLLSGYGIEAVLQHDPDRVDDKRPPNAEVIEMLKRGVKVVIVDYRT